MDLKKKIAAAALLCFSTLPIAVAKPVEVSSMQNTLKMHAEVTEAKSKIEFDSQALSKIYKDVTSEDRVMEALELLKGTIGNYSRNAILGDNLTNKAMKVEFKNLAYIKPDYANFDALGWKKGSRLYIYINEKHSDAPAAAIAALLSHEALHQDELDSLNEETYAWTMEAAVWTQLSEQDPASANEYHPLVTRENTLKKLLAKGDFTSKYIEKAVFSNPGYQSLPTRSPGYEDENL